MRKINIVAFVMAIALPLSVVAASSSDSSATGVAYFGKVFEKSGIDGVGKEIINCYKSASDVGFVEMCHGLDFAAGFATANNPQLLSAKNKDFFSIDLRVNRLKNALNRLGVNYSLVESNSNSWPEKSMAAFQRIYMAK